VHISTFQNALNEAASGKTVNWIGKADVHRQYVYVPDAMRIAAAVGARAEAFGRIGVCPAVARSAAARHRGASSRPLRQAALVGLTTLRILGLFNRDLRGFLQVAPDEAGPLRCKLQGLLGPPQMTAYDAGISETLSWIASRR
jgi:hypothetical protein